ncbi:hypothetical protein C2845_PM14G18510 [Panicum miliaceum]|uniref:Uncharacterized protein n=1 Tax=Panicum miliaceum TaxID=4540 RepID=A0A3L6PNT3_PANMI|nr:hypothetical protein C2845_PM14G18510 [Panicum miliaceum]
MPVVRQNLGTGSEQCSCEIQSVTRTHRHSTAGLATGTRNGVSSYIYLDYIVAVAVAPVAVTTSLTPKDQERRKKKLLQSLLLVVSRVLEVGHGEGPRGPERARVRVPPHLAAGGVHAQPRGRERRRPPAPEPAAGAARLLVLVLVLVVRALLVVLLHHGVVGGEERREVCRGQRAAGRAPPVPRRQHAASLVERVLRLGDLLGRRRRRGLRQARERLGLARVEVGEAAPAGFHASHADSFWSVQSWSKRNLVDRDSSGCIAC